jgi:membrane associated rhomboid family serine protease
MIFPYGDDQVKGGHFPLFSYGFILANIAVFILQLQFSGHLVCQYGAIPEEILSGQDVFTLISSMFLHGGWGHLLGNMLFLWIFADNIEATIGNLRFLVFYLLGGIVAVAAHIFFNSGESAYCCNPCGGGVPCMGDMPACAGLTPMVGASGAISAVMGAYLVLFPTSRIKLFFFIFPFRLPAFIFLGFWIYQQWAAGMAALRAVAAESQGVAWWAHIGGFAFGIAAGFYFRSLRKRQRQWMEEEEYPYSGFN